MAVEEKDGRMDGQTLYYGDASRILKRNQRREANYTCEIERKLYKKRQVEQQHDGAHLFLFLGWGVIFFPSEMALEKEKLFKKKE